MQRTQQACTVTASHEAGSTGSMSGVTGIFLWPYLHPSWTQLTLIRFAGWAMLADGSTRAPTKHAMAIWLSALPRTTGGWLADTAP